MKKLIILILIAFLTGCTQIVTAPISIATKTVSGAIDIAGSIGGAVVNTVSGGDDD